MISIKTPQQIDAMRAAGRLTAEALAHLSEFVRPGITTGELDEIAYQYVLKAGAKPSFLHYMGYPASICASVDDVVVHGIPSKDQVLEEGQILSVDFGAYLGGYHGDMARTFAVGKVDREKERLIRVTEESFWEGVRQIRDGVNLQEVSRSIQEYAEARGFGVVRDLTGHGIGKKMHEDPSVPNYDAGLSVVLRAGMTIAIEPMITAGDYRVRFDGWPVFTKDGSAAAHYENTVLVTQDGYEILTKCGDLNG